ncbi:MAG: hypothetical protein MJB57_09485 [Gemmatimonadetes bacterium]|nr:hypothetical protein [Gemmatimonadota bacterium]
MTQDGNATLTIPEWAGELEDAFDAEARQLDTLVEILRCQRQGVERHEVGPIQDSVYAIHRVLLTLDEARKRRRTLLEVIDAGSTEDATAPDRLERSKKRLIAAARSLESELSLNRRVLEAALSATDEELRAVLDGLEESATYATEAGVADPRAGRLVNRQA